MDRRELLIGGGAAVLLGLLPRALAAAPQRFASDRLSVQVRGSGPDVILIPGLSASRAVWEDMVAAVPGYRYHLIQVAGFAGDPARGNAAGPVLAPLADEIARYVRTAGLRAPALIGHSMGGTLAMMAAARHPAAVGRLMVVDMLPAPAGLFGASAATIRPLADRLVALAALPGGRSLLASLLGAFGAGPGFASSDLDMVARSAHELALIDLTPDLPRIAAPMTVLFATPPPGQGVDPAGVTRAYRDAYAGATGAWLVAIANSGHMVMYDQPARFHDAVRAFLKDAKPAGTPN